VLAISLLGPPHIRSGDEPVSFDTRKATALLAHLVLTERPRSRAALCELLWPGQDPEHARAALRRTLSALRKAVGEEWIDAEADSVALRDGDQLTVDVRRFRSLTAEHATALELAEAVELFRGQLLEGFALRDSPEFDAWQTSEARALERELASALRRLVESLVEEGQLERALPLARRWLEVDPLHEPAHRALIRLYAWTGDRAAALEQYRACVRTLSQELGVAPLEETAMLYEQVNEGGLEPPSATRAAAAEPATGDAAAPPELPLVGRSDELTALVRVHADARPDGRLAVVEGEAGVGKTRLASELLREARSRGAMVLSSRCHDDEAGLPYGPVVELLRAAATRSDWREMVSPQRLADAALLLPELAPEDVPTTLPLDGPGAQVRLLEAIGAVIAAACDGPEPGVVLVDDVHAADGATLDVIAHLGRRLTSRSLLLVLCWRTEGIPPGHRLRRLVADLARDGRAATVRPARLSEGDVATLVCAVQGEGAAPDLQQRVFLESEGLPLFVAEYLAALHAGHETLPPEVRDVLDARLSGLGAVAQQILGAAAVIGRSFDLETLHDASGRSDDETVVALEELMAHGLVREGAGPEPVYDFSHQKLRERVYEQTGLARRRLLHQRVAIALERRHPGGDNAALVAQHLRLAGDSAGAVRQYQLAAEHAVAVHAHSDAVEHLETALALGPGDAAALLERIGDLRTLLGDYARALANYESAAAQSDAAAAARIEHKIGGVHVRRGEWDRAEARLVAALAAAPADALGLRARIRADLALTMQHAGRTERAVTEASEALELAKAGADARAEAQAQNMLGALARHAGDSEAGMAHLERSLELARELRDPEAEAAALNNLALLERDAGELGTAVELTEQALALCAEHGDRHREAALENNLADLHHAAGHEEEAMAHLKRAVAVFSEVGADDATRLPEIWKLVSW
jgi:DNA-binding SARP family transcriptional activator/predicted ATPase